MNKESSIIILNKIVKELLQHPNIKVNFRNLYIETALILVVENNDLEIVKELLKHPDIKVNLKDNQGYTSLQLASEKSYSKISGRN